MTQLLLEGRTQTSVKDLQRHWGEVADKALLEPVVITSKGRPRHVLMSVAEYERIISETRKAYWVRDLPEPLLAVLEEGLAELRVPDGTLDDETQIR